MNTIPLEALPVWAIIADYALGLIMWTLVGRAAFRLFMAEDSPFFFNRIFIRLTDPVMKAFRWITPSFLVDPLKPLFVAWFFFMARFYLMPWLLGYSVMGMLSFPLEGEVAAVIWNILRPGW